MMLFAGFVARLGGAHLPRRVAFGEWLGRKGCSGGKANDRKVSERVRYNGDNSLRPRTKPSLAVTSPK